MTDKKLDTSPLRTEHVTVDGIEGKYARVELPDGNTPDWLLSTLPAGIREGDVLAVKEDGDSIEIDHAETRRRKAKAQAKLEAMNQNAPSGEIDL